MNMQERLFELADEKYALFQAKLTPTVDRELFIGVRVPDARKLAKEVYSSGTYTDFLDGLPHKYYDENMLHGLIVSEIKDFDECIRYLEKFLPFVDNWAVCDIMSPKCFKKHKNELMTFINKWISSSEEYTVRFGLEMLMTHFLDDDFKSEYLEKASLIRSDRYYVNMMLAWLFATSLAKQWDETVKYIENRLLDVWVHNKTIQKAVESYRITDERKNYLKEFKIHTVTE